MEVIIGVSNRHVHVTKKDLETLFGIGYELTKVKELLQPRQFASNEYVSIESSKGRIDKVRVIGPVRDYTQVEISKTDAIKLKLDPPIRDSGDLKGSEPITIIGPKGTIVKEEGCIIANRHIHMTPKKQAELGLLGKSEVSIKLDGEKGGILHHVVLKVMEEATYELHIDTDDANAHYAKTGDYATILEEENE